ncbi:MAG: metallophosphoesterase [Spirochaetota bacterium]
MIKILCLSDEIDPLVYSENIKERYGDVNFVIGAGDLELPYYGYVVSLINRPLYFVFGNHHLKHLRDFAKSYSIERQYQLPIEQLTNHFGSTYIGEQVVRDKKTGLILTGFGGSHRYNNGKHQFSEFQMRMRIFKRVPKMLYYRLRYGRWVDVVVTHAPPLGIHDRSDPCHRGFDAFLWFMRVFRPKYLLHGHVHLYGLNDKRSDVYESTQVINVYKSFVLEVPQGNE